MESVEEFSEFTGGSRESRKAKGGRELGKEFERPTT